VTMRQLNLAETLDASIKTVRERWRTLAIIMLVVTVPMQVAKVAITATTFEDYKVGSGVPTTPVDVNGDGDALILGGTALLTLTILGYLLGTVACYRVIAQARRGEEVGARAALRYAVEGLGPALWLTIMLVLGIVLGLFAFIVPGFWLLVAWSVAYPALLVEDLRGVGALRRSFGLTQGAWWATLGRLATAYLLVIAIGALLSGVIIAPFDEASLAALIAQAVASLLTSLFTTPFVAAVTTLVYFDLRARKEGFDPRPPVPLPGGWAPPIAPEPRRPDEA
jgi:hypothetical protein